MALLLLVVVGDGTEEGLTSSTYSSFGESILERITREIPRGIGFN